MELLGVIVDLGGDPHIVGDPVGKDKVDPKKNLVLGHDLLAGQVHLQQPGIHKVHLHLHGRLPKVVDAGLQKPIQLFIQIQPGLLVRGYLYPLVQVGGELLEEVDREVLFHKGAGKVH